MFFIHSSFTVGEMEAGFHTTLWNEPDHSETLGIKNRFSTAAAKPQIVPGPLPLSLFFCILH